MWHLRETENPERITVTAQQCTFSVMQASFQPECPVQKAKLSLVSPGVDSLVALCLSTLQFCYKQTMKLVSPRNMNAARPWEEWAPWIRFKTGLSAHSSSLASALLLVEVLLRPSHRVVYLHTVLKQHHSCQNRRHAQTLSLTFSHTRNECTP